MMGQSNAIDVLRVFMNWSEPWYRLESIVALAQYKSPEAIELLKLKTADHSLAVARAAAAALSGKLTGALIEALADEDEKVRRGAAFTFLFFNDPEAIPALRRACYDKDVETRNAARWAVRRLQRMNGAELPK